MSDNLPVVDPGAGYELALRNANETLELIRENMGPKGLSGFDLPALSVPSGNSPFFTVLVDGEPKPMSTVTGIIVERRDTRAYWRTAIGEAGASDGPPDCRSSDSIVGVGDPGGICSACPYSKFGPKGEAPDCPERMMLFFLMPDSMLPYRLSVPPTSLGNWKKFGSQLLASMSPYHRVVTTISLAKDTNRDNVAFFRLEFKIANRIPKEYHDALANWRATMLPIFTKALEAAPARAAEKSAGDVKPVDLTDEELGIGAVEIGEKPDGSEAGF